MHDGSLEDVGSKSGRPRRYRCVLHECAGCRCRGGLHPGALGASTIGDPIPGSARRGAKTWGDMGGRSRIFFDEPVSTSSENALERRALYRDHSASIYLGPQRGCQGSIASPICGARRVLPVVCGPLACGRTPPPASTFLPSGIGVCGMYSACLHEQPLMYSLR